MSWSERKLSWKRTVRFLSNCSILLINISSGSALLGNWKLQENTQVSSSDSVAGLEKERQVRIFLSNLPQFFSQLYYEFDFTYNNEELDQSWCFVQENIWFIIGYKIINTFIALDT